MVAVPFSKGRETVADIVNGPTYKRAPFKIEHNQPTPASRNTECFSEDSLQMNPANMKEYNPAAPNGSYDLTKPTSKGHASSVACVRSPPRCPLLPSWQLHSRLGSDPLRVRSASTIATCGRERSTRPRTSRSTPRWQSPTTTWSAAACPTPASCPASSSTRTADNSCRRCPSAVSVARARGAPACVPVAHMCRTSKQKATWATSFYI